MRPNISQLTASMRYSWKLWINDTFDKALPCRYSYYDSSTLFAGFVTV